VAKPHPRICNRNFWGTALARAALACALLVFGCARSPAGHRIVTAVDIQGGPAADDAELKHGIATRADASYDPSVLAKDLERIERRYRALGYYDAKVSAARVVNTSPDRVRVEIAVEPGAPVRIARIDVHGADELPADAASHLRAARLLRAGAPLNEGRLHQDARDMENGLADDGFAYAHVTESATVSVQQKSAVVTYTVKAGPRVRIGAIQIEGLRAFDERIVRGKLLLDPGARYSRRALELARRRLYELGVFSSVDVTPVLDNPTGDTVPIHVVVREGTTRAVHIGAAAEVDNVRGLTGVRFGWDNRNFLGGLRKLSFDITPALTFYPLPSADTKTRVLPTLQSAIQFDQPGIFDARTTGFVRNELNAYPVIYADYQPGDNIVGFRELKDMIGAERPFAGGALHARASYEFQARFPHMYLGERPAGLDTILVFFPQIVLNLDLRDDPIDPRSGAYFELSAQAAGLLFGDATDLRFRPEARFYAKLASKLTLGFRTTFGFLFPRRCDDSPTRGCYGDSLTTTSTNPATDSALVRDQQILLFRGFYSGGATSNRGYSLNEVGPHGVLGFLAPSNINCTVPNPPTQCERPLGGLTLWEASLELRVILSQIAGLVFFIDTSDLTREPAYFRAAYPHLSTGTGFRLRTPVGAVRLDAGVRVPYLQHIGYAHLPSDEGEPSTFLGLPMAVHFGLGEAF
jgi:outer membrane protein insertion porin family/translocation and assembly module TamA